MPAREVGADRGTRAHKSALLWEAAHGQWMGIANPDAVSRSALFPKFKADALVAMITNLLAKTT